MLDNFDHKFKGKRGYNFSVIFVGILFAAFLILPEKYHTLTPLAFVTVVSFVIAHFTSSNMQRRKDEDK